MGPECPARGRATILALVLALAGSGAVSGASREEVDRLAGPDPGGVTGRILAPSGQPASGIEVVLQRGTRSRSTRTNEEGEFCFCRVEPGRDYRLAVEAEGFARWEERDLQVSRGRLIIRNVMLRALSEFKPVETEPE